MKYTYMLNMDNEKAESCDVVVKFLIDPCGRFDGFTSITSNKPLYSEDLAYLEEWVMQGKDKWYPRINN
tara:strand:- start:218 stop:424 length:207 start_codon:yes stop_codon:yes gene_type:complete